MLKQKITDKLKLLLKIFNYNLKIIFANKFIFFLLGAFGFYLMIAVIILLDPESYFSEGDVYNLLLFPGILRFSGFRTTIIFLGCLHNLYKCGRKNSAEKNLVF